MLKEERELREFLKDGIVMYDKWMKDGGNRRLSAKITALVRAVREDERDMCAKVITPYKLCDGCARHFIDAIRSKPEGKEGK